MNRVCIVWESASCKSASCESENEYFNKQILILSVFSTKTILQRAKDDTKHGLDWTVGLDSWTGQLDWTVGLDSWTGQLDWTVGLDYWTGFRKGFFFIKQMQFD